MTEKDRDLVEKLLEKSIGQQNKLFETQFDNVTQLLNSMYELFTEKLNTIDGKVSKTNGTVLKHEERILANEKELSSHVVTCTKGKDIDILKEKITNIEKMEVGRNAVSKFTLKQISLLGAIVGIVFTILNFIVKIINI